jgi:DNA-binding NtrC family response regulator
MIANHEFREDLYYRLKVVDLDLPSLAERQVDIPELVGYFLKLFNMQMGANILDVTPKAMEALINYSWPGNVRELRNAMERAVLLCDEATIDIGHLPRDITSPGVSRG